MIKSAGYWLATSRQILLASGSVASFAARSAFERLHASARLLIRNGLFACIAPGSRCAGMSFKLLGVFCSVPPLSSHIEIHTASVSVGSHLSGALALQRFLPARACPIVHIHKTLAANGTFQTTLELPALCRSLIDFDQDFRAAVQHAIQYAGLRQLSEP